MLPFKNRLTKKREVERIRKYGQACFSGNIVLKMATSGLSQTRIGFVVGLSFSPKAVERNSMKRLLREILRQKLPDMKTGIDIVVIARKRKGEKIRKEKIKESLEDVLQRMGMLVKRPD